MIHSKLHLAVAKLFFGKFSYTYQSKTIHSLSSFKNCNYLNPCSKLTALNHYAAVLVHQEKSIPTFQSKEQINFGSLSFGDCFKKIRQKHRRFHCYDIEKYNDFFWQRYGIKERIQNYGLTRVFHFLDKEFFFGELFFKDSQIIDVQIIKKTLLSKYVPDDSVEKGSNFQIELSDGLIFFEDTGINLSVKYIWTGDSAINEKLKQIIPASASQNLNEIDAETDIF